MSGGINADRPILQAGFEIRTSVPDSRCVSTGLSRRHQADGAPSPKMQMPYLRLLQDLPASYGCRVPWQ